jgi:hypothetical protein
MDRPVEAGTDYPSLPTIIARPNPSLFPLVGLAVINRELTAKAETIESPQRVVLDMDSTEIPVYGQRSRAPTTATSSPLAITRCCCSIVKATVWRQSRARQRPQCRVTMKLRARPGVNGIF